MTYMMNEVGKFVGSECSVLEMEDRCGQRPWRRLRRGDSEAQAHRGPCDLLAKPCGLGRRPDFRGDRRHRRADVRGVSQDVASSVKP